jgi:methyltransferase family protein
MADTYGWPSTMTATDPHDDLDMDSDWRRFVARENLPPAIRDHLESERDFLRGVIAGGAYDTVIEGGCADGSLFLPVVLAAGVDYIGVDVVAQAVQATWAAIRRHPLAPGQRAAAVHGDIRALDDVDGLADLGGRTLVTLPFNLFGIVARPYESLRSAAAIGADVLIFTYRLAPEASAARAAYFQRGGWAAHEVQMNDGAHYTADHFISSVYTPDTVNRWLREAGYQAAEAHYGAIGRAAQGTLPAGPVGKVRPRATEIVEPTN